MKRKILLRIACILTFSSFVFFSCNTNGKKGGGQINVPESPAEKTFSLGEIKFTMKKIPKADNVKLGDNNYECASNGKCNKEHTVSISEFYMATTETTQELYEAVMGQNPSMWKGRAADGEVAEKQPVERITWHSAVAFCNKLTMMIAKDEGASCVYYSDKELKTPYTDKDALVKKDTFIDMGKQGFRLPTDAEWEWAARGGKNDKWAGTSNESELKDYAWYVGSNTGNVGRSHQVALKQPNGYGLYDMSGNVWELCYDWYSPLGEEDLGQDPTGGTEETSKGRVMRGGSTHNYSQTVTVTSRNGLSFPPALDIVGFRIAYRLKS